MSQIIHTKHSENPTSAPTPSKQFNISLPSSIGLQLRLANKKKTNKKNSNSTEELFKS